MMNVLHSAGENGALGFFARSARDDTAQFVDAFVNISSASTLNFFL
jgi:hypothetical protein